MSNRERWVIYPLLFLALGFALKPKFVPPERFKCQSIECDDLIVSNSLLARRTIQTGRINTGKLHVNGSAQVGTLLTVPVLQTTSAVSSDFKVKTLSIIDDDGKSRMRMGTQGVAKDGTAKTFDSGRIELYGKDQKPILVLASTDSGQSGLVVVSDSSGQNQGILRASANGGRLYLHDSNGRVQIFQVDRSLLLRPKKPVPKKPAAKKS